MKLYVGIDIGGTTVKGMLCDGQANVLKEAQTPTGVGHGNAAVCDNIASLINTLLCDVDKNNVAGVGIGCPGIIDSEHGVIVFAANLNMTNFALADELHSRVRLPIKMTNDANAAALGEARFGAGKEYSDSILVTLGTGVGGGIIIGGKLFEGNKSAGAEIGHMVIERHGETCNCGRRGCFEQYCSATALIRRTKKAMTENPGSLMWTNYTVETCDGQTAFRFADCDIAAREVVQWYMEYLAVGLANLANIFRPQAILLGGGISGEGERLTAPVQQLLNKKIFGGVDYAPVKVLCASLGNRAGSFGAAALFMD